MDILNHGLGTPVQIDVIAGNAMLMLLSLTLSIVVVLLAFPDTPMGQGLRRGLIDTPARALNRIPRGKAVFYLALAIFGMVLTLLFEAEGVRFFGFLAPDTLVWFAMFDVGVFVDALLITGAILATNGLRIMKTQAEALTQRVTAAVSTRWTGRARRPRIVARQPRKSADDDDGPRWPQPVYRAFSMA